MTENRFFGEGRQSVESFLLEEYPSLTSEMKTQIIKFLPLINEYMEEGVKLRPTIIFCNSCDRLVKNVKEAYNLLVFEDKDESSFRLRLKALAAFSRHGWNIYIEKKTDSINYGLIKCLNSIKEESFENLLFKSNLKNIDGVEIVVIKAISGTATSIKSIHGKELIIDFSLTFATNIFERDQSLLDFVDDTFAKLRTTKQKLQDIKTLFNNIFDKARRSISGTLCVIVDKDYTDNGFLEDGVWLKTPIEFSKLFLQSKSYSEAKLLEMSNLFMDMLNYDGIVVMDNIGRVRAYNVFIESSSSKAANIVGGARKRAAYTIINTKRKKIIGVYFQSHDGELFYARVKQQQVADKVLPKDTNNKT